MKTISVNGKVNKKGRLRVEAETDLPQGEVDVVLVIDPGPGDRSRRRYDFSGIAGKLQWKGDAVKAQRVLRDEW